MDVKYPHAPQCYGACIYPCGVGCRRGQLRGAVIAVAAAVLAACTASPMPTATRSAPSPPTAPTTAGPDAVTAPDAQRTPTTSPAPVLADASVLLVVGSDGACNDSEMQLLSHLEDLGAAVSVVSDQALRSRDLGAHAGVVVSKTVQSTTLGTALGDAPAGVLLWEDNLQGRSLMALIDDDGDQGTAWHTAGTTIHVRPEAPAALRGGASGTTPWYRERDEITYAPVPIAGATVVATLAADDRRAPLYVIERGTPLADGSRAAGRRAYVGLYDDTFRLLTPEGLELFDAILRWTISGRPEAGHDGQPSPAGT